MQRFIGTELVLAKPMTLGEYNKYRGWTIPEDEDPSTEGVLIEYLDGGKPNHDLHQGYISWSPMDVFTKSYRRTGNGMTFSSALEALKLGKAVCRSGWNGKGMYLYLVKEGRYPPTTPTGRLIAAQCKDGLVPYGPYIAMWTAQKNVVPWLASQTDIIADDWEIVELNTGQ
jgi:hypothetical protein